jgi:hypothetical protein
VLFVNGPERLRSILTLLIRSSSSRGILVADEVDDAAVGNAVEALAGIGGRWRIIGISSASTRRRPAEGQRNLVLPPLDAGAMRALVVEYSGLEERQAQMIATVASGFPLLAFRLADELRADPDLDLVRLARLPYPEELLKRALNDEDLRRHLAPIALFSRVGFDGDVAYQATSVAEAFALDPAALVHLSDAELERDRFVSRAGRYRSVSPLLVAIWLAADLIESTPGFEQKVFDLPQPLQDAFAEQLEYFGPDTPHLPQALRNVIADDRFRRPSAFSEAAGRFLRASAAIVPAQVADSIHDLIHSSNSDELETIPRRDLIWALQVLLWWEQSWASAASSLLVLAVHENETWSNNATGVFQDAFSVVLSGSTIPYSERAAWLRERILQADQDQLMLLAGAAASGLSDFHTRMSVGFRGGGEPSDWRPGSNQEFRSSVLTAWRLVLEARDRAAEPARSQATTHLANGLRAAVRWGLADEVLADIADRSWNLSERTALATALRGVRRYESEMEYDRREVDAALESLLGNDVAQRIEGVLHIELWDLAEDVREGLEEPPPILVELADRLAASGDGLEVALSTKDDEKARPNTRYSLMRLLSERLGALHVARSARAEDDWLSVGAALSFADTDEPGLVDEFLAEVSGASPGRVPELLLRVSLTESRVRLVLDLVDAGSASASDLGRLLYGARIRTLGERPATRVIEAVGGAGETEAALGMALQWLEIEGAVAGDEFKNAVGSIALSAVRSGDEGMTEFYVEKLVEIGAVPVELIPEIWRERVMNRPGLVGDLDILLTERVLATHDQHHGPILDLVRQRSATFGLFSSTDLALLSRLAAASSVAEVWDDLKEWPDEDLGWALHHMDWKGTEPDPLVKRFLTSDRLDDALSRGANACFFNTLGVVRGSFADGLERELNRALSWQRELAGTSGESWARGLVDRYRADIELHRAREAEDHMPPL